MPCERIFRTCLKQLKLSLSPLVEFMRQVAYLLAFPTTHGAVFMSEQEGA